MVDEQQGTSRRSVLLAGLALLIACGLFAGAFYVLDGAAMVAALLGDLTGAQAPSAPPSSVATSPTALQLPAGMPKEFALRLWQEQVDSQDMIEKLVSGDITSMRITKVESSSADATLSVDVRDKRRSLIRGVIGMRRFGDNWYVAFASADHEGRVKRPAGPLPDVADVDVQLLNTILAEQAKSQPVFDEYVAGSVSSIDFKKVNPGPRTTTLEAAMNEDHGEGYAQLVAIRSDKGPEPLWFIARFIKTGHDPAGL